MAYKVSEFHISQMTSVDKLEGETIEQKMERIVENGEPIEDGAPEIFTERKHGVNRAYNIRTDRWEVACEAMDKVHMNAYAKRDDLGKVPEMKIVEKPTGTEGDNGVSEA